MEESNILKRKYKFKQPSLYDRFIKFLKLLYDIIILFFRTLFGEDPAPRSGGINHNRRTIPMGGGWG